MRMQIHRPRSPLTFGVVVLMAILVRGVQRDSTAESGPSGETLQPPIDEVPAQRFDRNFESFAPAVEKVAPAVVRIVANAARFFESFNFVSAVQAGHSMGGTLLLSALHLWVPRGTSCAKSPIMLNEFENTSQDNALLAVITAEDFKDEVLESKQPVLVEFWAPWSRPCQVMDSVLHELASAWAGNVKVVKVNADDSLDLSLCYDIQSIPTLLYFVEGKLRVQIVGTATKAAILAKLKAFGFANNTLVKEASGAGAATSKGGLV
jgi:thioredoxin 1